MYKSSIDILPLELKPNSITNDGLTSISQSIAKPPVGGSTFLGLKNFFHN
jgi:hypothetical protein